MLEQIFLQQLCICYHSIKEEHENNQCFALDYNGTTYSACRCNNIKLISFKLSIEREMEDESIREDKIEETKRIEVRKINSTKSPDSAANSAVSGESSESNTTNKGVGIRFTDLFKKKAS